jgi:para-nitrobenzyl esterase
MVIGSTIPSNTPELGLPPGAQFRVVETDKGKLRGRVCHGLAEFKGIPYGASTTGANRFMPPQPVNPWPGVRDALCLGNQSPQINDDFPYWLDPSPMGEDCLTLNVWAPGTADGRSRLPVMVWVHGGGYRFGSAGAPGYDGGSLASFGNVVVVGINHRLNIFGYTFVGGTDERFSTSGNVGQLDLVAALEWVRDNIECFGGDPSNVTIFGQSGGGGKIAALLGMPIARGLFHKAIVQSVSALRMREISDAQELTDRMFAQLGMRNGDVDALQRLSCSALLDAYDKLWNSIPNERRSRIAYKPVVDGEILDRQPWLDQPPSAARNIPIMVGNTLHETIAFTGLTDDLCLQAPQHIAAKVAEITVMSGFDPQAILPIIEAYKRTMPSLTARELTVRVSTDLGFWKNTLELAELQSGTAPVFAYECRWKTPCFGDMWAPHGIDLPFIFNHPVYGPAWDGEDCDAARAAADPVNERCGVGTQMSQAWVNFARNGDPSTAKLSWPAFNANQRATMLFDGKSRVITDVRPDVRDLIAAA